MKVKIRCHSCEGVGYVKETEFYLNEEVKVLCPECDGKGFVKAQKYVEDVVERIQRIQEKYTRIEIDQLLAKKENKSEEP